MSTAMNTAPAAAPADAASTTTGQPIARPGYQLSDALWADHGAVFLTGTQALLRLLRMQRQRDDAAGLATQGFISGYRGSPLGMVDQAVWKAGERFTQAGIRFLPAINEELAATAVLGTQRVEADAARTCDGVFALWYGKGPGVDRAGDALKHGHAYGASPHGGVLMVAGDDHGCVSSSMPHQSDQAFQSWQAPVLSPGSVAEMIEFGLYGWALSRYSGAWVGFTAPSEVVESGSTVDLDAIHARVAAWQGADAVRAATGHQAPAGGLHNRWPDLPSLGIEERLAAKLDAVRAFARVNRIDHEVVRCDAARVGIVTVGKAHFDLMEALRRLHIGTEALAAHGVRVLKLGLSFPVEPLRITAFASGLRELLVVEEKGAVVETQLRALFYNAPAGQRPAIAGKHDAAGAPLVSALGELRPSRLITLLADWLARHTAAPAAGDTAGAAHADAAPAGLDRRALVRDFLPPALLSNGADAVKRAPYFCAGCPHNTSTRVPEGSSAQAGIGCHFMASWMDRGTQGLIQMGGEGVDWVSHAMFTRTPHIFQNLGDGTYYHSGYLAIRQAVAAKATLTYKILFNDAVAMTGGQPVDGQITVDGIARQVEAEGVVQVVVLSDDIARYAGQHQRFPAGTTFHDRHELDAVQRHLRSLPGVSVLIYEQTCAAEKRRRRKQGKLADPPKRLFINEQVCEGCGDCTVQSNCVAVLPHETPDGRKRRIDQSSCNKDYRCADGFCPSFVTVSGGRPRQRAGALLGGGGGGAFAQRVNALPLPAPHHWDAPYDLLVTGVGGTGVVTVGALITMAAHLEGRAASVLDFMGFAQKGGAVLSFVRLADAPERLHQVRIDAQQADALLACDLVVGASADALVTVRAGRTRILANTHEVPVAEHLHNPDASLRVPELLDKLRHAAGSAALHTLDAQALADAFLGDAIYSNIVCLGFAWQLGLVPVGLAALQQAITLNGVAVANNRLALSLGRLAAADPAALAALRDAPASPSTTPEHQPLAALMARHRAELAAYHSAAYAERYAAILAPVLQREQALAGSGLAASATGSTAGAASTDSADSALPLSRAAARSLFKLMAIKDEYEVARLYTNGRFAQQLAAQFEGDVQLRFHLAPPLLSRSRTVDGVVQPPRKISLGPWLLPVLKLLAAARRLRGRWCDPFGHSAERRLERALVDQFSQRLHGLLPALTPQRLALATQIAALPLSVRGFGHVKLASLALARAREAELLHRFDPALHPRPAAAAGPAGLPQAGQLRGIAVVADHR
jgi:indolepyruvate ferredoxin oxidoreductase